MMTSRSLTFPAAILCMGALSAGCGPVDSEESATPTISLGSPTPTSQALICSEPSVVACEDELILDLGLVEGTVSAGEINTVSVDGYFQSEVDATAGGFQNAADNPWTYLRFTPEGGEKVDIDDLESLDSMDWHIAFKRYEIRLNSGTSGPSCVGAAAVDGDFEAVNEAPSGTVYYGEDFFDDSCNIITDDKGLGGADVALGPWWAYNGCVTTTGQVFLVELDTGAVVKLVVDAYYAEGQDTCNTSGTMGSGSANLSLRWAFVQ